jgi:type 1 glutamine amidotransferase
MRWPAGVVFAWLAAAGCSDGAAHDDGTLWVFVFTRETDWMHPSNPVAAQALQDLGERRGWNVTVSDDPVDVNDDRLDQTDVVVFSLTSGNILGPDERRKLESYFARGGGFVGIHSASHTEWDWPFFLSRVVPVTFLTHPFPMNVLPGTITVENDHPIVEGVPRPWADADEFYTFAERPEDIPGLTILLALDETKMGAEYPDGDRVGYHPIAFTHELSGGRSFYTALGHTPESYADPVFMGMLERAIDWSADR